MSSDSSWKEVSNRQNRGNYGFEQGNNFAPSLNLSLNIGIKRRLSYIFDMAAVLGFLLQFGVLLFAAIVVYVLPRS
jgi:hypothetical protein